MPHIRQLPVMVCLAVLPGLCQVQSSAGQAPNSGSSGSANSVESGDLFAGTALSGTALSGTVFAGTGQSPNTKKESGDAPEIAGASPTQVDLGNPFGVATSRPDEVLLTTVDDHSVWRLRPSDQSIARIAGNGTLGYSGDGGPASKATMNWPHEVRVTKEGDLYIADTRNHVIRRVDGKTQIITTLAGNGQPGFAGDGRRGDLAQFDQPHSVVLDGEGGLLVADTKNHRVRHIDLQTRVVTTIAGTGKPKLPDEGADAKSTSLFGPRSLAVDADSIWLVLREGNSVWRIDRKTKTIHRVAGTGAKGHTGDGGDPLKATFRGPKGIAIDSLGRVLIVDTENHVVRRIDLKANTIETVSGLDRSKPMKRPHGIAPFGKSGFLVGDSENHRVLFGK